MIPLISFFAGSCLFKGTYHGPFLFFLFLSLSLFSTSGFANAGVSETQRLDFIQGFYYKNKVRGRVVHTREGREICKNKNRKKNKVENAHTQLLPRQRDIPRGQGATMPAPKYLSTYNDLKNPLNKNTRFLICK